MSQQTNDKLMKIIKIIVTVLPVVVCLWVVWYFFQVFIILFSNAFHLLSEEQAASILGVVNGICIFIGMILIIVRVKDIQKGTNGFETKFDGTSEKLPLLTVMKMDKEGLSDTSVTLEPDLNRLQEKPQNPILLDKITRAIDELPVPDVVKYKAHSLASECNAETIRDIIAYENTPEVIRKYLSRYSDEKPEVFGFDSDGCHVAGEDELYDSDEYESVNVGFDAQKDEAMVVLVNGKRMKNKRNKNPFEM